MSYGRNNNGVKKGSWGDGYLIENNFISKKASCYTCKNCFEKKSCKINGVFIPEIGSNTWKFCKNFLLSKEYFSESNFNLIGRVKGKLFLENMLNSFDDDKNSNISSKSELEEMKKNKEIKISNFNDLNADVLDSKINLISSICFKCIEKRINPTTFMTNVEKIMDKYLQYKNEVDGNSKVFEKSLMFINVLAQELGCTINELMFLSDEEKGQIFNEFLDDENYYFERDIWLGSHRIYKLSKEYKEAENYILKTGDIEKYGNKKTGELLPMQKWEEKWDLFTESFENNQLYGEWIIFSNPMLKLKYLENDSMEYYLYFKVYEYFDENNENNK